MSLEPTSPAGELDRTCPECGGGFTVESAASRRKYCSPVCREKGYAHLPKQRVCPQCGEEFTTDLSPKRKYCSSQCQNASRHNDDQQESRLCPVCDNPFQALKTIRTVYCSTACRQDAERVRDRALNEERNRRLAQTAPPPAPTRIELPPPPPARTAPRQPVPARDPLEPTATRNCPHCQQPITIVALLATPEAARPTMPRHHTDIVPLRRTP